jgi:hypothetical protein
LMKGLFPLSRESSRRQTSGFRAIQAEALEFP